MQASSSPLKKKGHHLLLTSRFPTAACQHRAGFAEITSFLGGNCTHHPRQETGLQADYTVLASLLGECARYKSLTEGRRVHIHIVCGSLDKKPLLGNLLIKLYGACGHVMDAVSIFDRMPSRNVISWTLIMNIYIQQDDFKGAMDLYSKMHKSGVNPNSIALVTILGATSPNEGKMIHACVVEYGFDTDAILETALINMYRRCSCIGSVRWLFDKMDSKDVVAWNTLIAAYIHLGQLTEAIELFFQLEQHNVEVNHVSCVTILGACYGPAAIFQGLVVHSGIVEAGLETDVGVVSALVTMYSKCKSVDDAYGVFDMIKHRSVILWNAMTSALIENCEMRQAIALYKEMNLEEVPNDITLLNALIASAALTSILHGMDVHTSAVFLNLESQTLIGTAVLNMYGKCGDVKSARRVFDKLSCKDLVSWNAMLSIYVMNEQVKEAFQLHQQMLVSCTVPDRISFNMLLGACCRPGYLLQGHMIHKSVITYGVEKQAGVGVGLVSMYTKCGSIEAARNAFDRQDSKDLHLWNIMLAGYMQTNSGKEALLMYSKMRENGVEPDVFTFSAVVGACSEIAALDVGKEIYGAIVDGGFDSDGAVGNALVHMYCKCGNMEDAWSVFGRLHDQSTIAWNSIVSGFAEHGYGNEALNVYRKMQKRTIKANNITLVGVLSGCAHVGLVDEGLGLFQSLTESCDPTPDLEHCACIVDLFGRVGRTEEAEKFIQQAPIQPDIVIWKGLLVSCKVHDDMVRGRNAAKHSVELDSDNTLSYVLLSNLYATRCDISFRDSI